MNVPQTILNWIRSFLSDRRQRVMLTNPINDLLTDWQNRWKYVDDCSFAESVTPKEGSKLQELVNVIYN